MALRAVPDHPKFAELKMLLGRPKCVALGCLEAIWHFTGRFCPAGDIGKYSDAAIEGWVEWDGPAGALIAALVQSRWLDADEPYRLIVHDWDQFADVLVHTTLARSCQRFANGSIPECGRLNQRERERFNAWLESQGVTPRPVGRPAEKQPKSSQKSDSLSGSTAKIPKPEPEPEPEPAKRLCAEPSPAPALDENGAPLALPTNTGALWPVAAQDCLAWADAYPGVNVLAEVKKARVWLDANPRNRKTASGMRRFLVSWLNRAQNQSRPTGGGGGIGNRGQARTDGNLFAAQGAAARLAARLAGDSRRGAGS